MCGKIARKRRKGSKEVSRENKKKYKEMMLSCQMNEERGNKS